MARSFGATVLILGVLLWLLWDFLRERLLWDVFFAHPNFPLLLVFAGLLLLVVSSLTDTLRRQQIVDRWDTLIPGAQGQSEQVVKGTVGSLASLKIPHIALEERTLAAGTLRGLLGDTRPFLVVTHTHNRRLAPFKMYVNVRDYGETLQTSWYLAYQPRWWERLRRKLTPTYLTRLDLFDEQDLRAYVGAVHRAFLDAVIELMTAMGKDTSKLNRSSKGFLGIS